MSTNMNGIVEGVERLVESDTYENAPTMPNHLAHPMDSNPTLAQFYDPTANSDFRRDNLHTPISPPGLGLPMDNYSSGLGTMSSSQSYTPRPTIPGLPNIWNTAFSPEIRDASPRTPPGLGPPQGSMLPRHTNSSGLQYTQQDAIKNDLAFRQSLLAQNQLESNSLNGSGPMSQMLAPQTYHQRHSSSPWDRDSISAAGPFSQQPYHQSAFAFPSQPMSSGQANASWANNAFIESSLPSGAGLSSPGIGDTRKSSAQFGVIGQGQSPRLGHGG